jgi:flavodoxin
MKTLVIYDSAFGNTAKIAEAIGGALGSPEEVRTLHVGDAKPEQAAEVTLLFVGSPTQGFRPLKSITAFLKSLPAGSLRGVKVAAFDTRISIEDIKSGMLRFMVNIGGYAAKPIARGLQKAGGELVLPPEGFFVEGTEGPLKEGELERAAAWAKRVLATG